MTLPRATSLAGLPRPVCHRYQERARKARLIPAEVELIPQEGDS